MENCSNETEEVTFIKDKNTVITYNRNDIIGWGSFSFNFQGLLNIRGKNPKEIAIKEIKLHSLIDPYDHLSLKSAMNEIDILKQLKHENIIKYRGFHRLSEEKIIIMQKLCKQGDLFTFLNKNQFMSQESVIWFFTQILTGYKYLFSMKIFHGDIKPENIFLHNNKVKIADFGMACKFKSVDQIFKEPRGSPGYMSPEILNGEEYTLESDIWSLGVTLYYMIYEQLPWADIKNPIKLSKHLNKLYEEKLELVNFPEKWRFPISAELKCLILRMICYDVRKRITWHELFKIKLICDGVKKTKKGLMQIHYKKKDENSVNKVVENYCSPLLLLDENEKNGINKIRIWEHNSCKI